MKIVFYDFYPRNMDAASLLTRILKKQNESIIRAIAAEYNLDVDILLTRYNTPTFYSIIPDTTKIYKLNFT